MLDPNSRSDALPRDLEGAANRVGEPPLQGLPASNRRVLDELRWESVRGDNPTSNDMSESVAIVFLGGFGMAVASAFGATGKGLLTPRNQHGNVMIDCPNLRLNIYHLDAISTESRAYLTDLLPVQGEEYRFCCLGDSAFGGDAVAMLRQMPRLYEGSPAVQEIFGENCKASLVVFVGSEAGTATYAVYQFMAQQRLATKSALLMATPSRLTARGKIPCRRPSPHERLDAFLEQVSNSARNTIFLVNSEKAVGVESGDTRVLPSIEDAAKVTARVLHDWLIPGCLEGSSSVGHHIDLPQISSPLFGKVVVPSFAPVSPSPVEAIGLLERGQLAGGFTRPEALMVLGQFPSTAYEEGLTLEIAARGLGHATYNLNRELHNGLMGLWVVDPSDATRMVDHLR